MNGDGQNRKVLCDIARTAFAIVGRLLSRDQLLARGLRSSETGSRQIYREECITVEMATGLREQFRDHVEITLFTPHEERRNGADWYWRIEKGKRAIHARVQAKRVRRTEFNQSDGQGIVDLDPAQLNVLVNETRNPPSDLRGLQAWLATYARFNASPPCDVGNLQVCRHHQHRGQCAQDTELEPCVWIAKAQDFHDSTSSQVTVKRMVEKSLRLDCILPCIDEPGAAAGPASKEFTLQSDLASFEDCVAAIEADEQLRKQFQGALRIAV